MLGVTLAVIRLAAALVFLLMPLTVALVPPDWLGALNAPLAVPEPVALCATVSVVRAAICVPVPDTLAFY